MPLEELREKYDPILRDLYEDDVHYFRANVTVHCRDELVWYNNQGQHFTVFEDTDNFLQWLENNDNDKYILHECIYEDDLDIYFDMHHAEKLNQRLQSLLESARDHIETLMQSRTEYNYPNYYDTKNTMQEIDKLKRELEEAKVYNPHQAPTTPWIDWKVRQ